MDGFSLPTTLMRTGKWLLRVFAVLLLTASLWGVVELVGMRGRSIRVVLGVAGPVQEAKQGSATVYHLPFTEEETGTEMTFRLHNNSPILDYMLTSVPTHTIALRYWPDDMSVLAVNPLLPDVPVAVYPTPSRSLQLATSVLGIVLAVVLLLPDLIDRVTFRSGRRARPR